jgi:nucleoside-diphosphate-sugar epimerase
MTKTPRDNQDRHPILITGAAGLIGSRLAESLLDEYPVVGFDVAKTDGQLPDVDWIRCDLTDANVVHQALTELRDRHGDQLSSVIHLAAYYDFSGQPSPLYDELTVQGTRRLLEGLRPFTVEQFVFSSTLLVMKPTSPGDVLTEQSPGEAEWDYPKSKLITEQLIAEQRGNTPAVILRIAGAYDEDCHSIPISEQIRRIYEQELQSHFFPGNSEHGQSFVHLDDLADCLVRVIRRRTDLGPHEIFLVGEPDFVSYGELQDLIGVGLHDTQWLTIRIPKTVAKVGAWTEEKFDQDPFIKPWMIDLADSHYPVDISKAKQLLGWQPRHSLRQTLPEMLRRLQNDPVRWYDENKLQLPEQLPK